MFGYLRRRKDAEPPLMRSGQYSDPDFGIVHATVRANACRLVARWRGRTLTVTVPPGITVDEYARIIGTMRPRLLGSRPAPLLEVGKVIGPEDFAIVIERRSDIGPLSVNGRAERPLRVYIGRNIDLANPAHEKVVVSMIRKVAESQFDRQIVPRALQLAGRVGANPRSIGCSRGFSRLGTCGQQGDIRLSAALMLMPQELRDYIILHEFAHLREFNHSPRFYALLDSYCGGRNDELKSRLKSFRFPIPV